jgi:hypothetical protein
MPGDDDFRVASVNTCETRSAPSSRIIRNTEKTVRAWTEMSMARLPVGVCTCKSICTIPRFGIDALLLISCRVAGHPIPRFGIDALLLISCRVAGHLLSYC